MKASVPVSSSSSVRMVGAATPLRAPRQRSPAVHAGAQGARGVLGLRTPLRSTRAPALTLSALALLQRAGPERAIGGTVAAEKSAYADPHDQGIQAKDCGDV